MLAQAKEKELADLLAAYQELGLESARVSATAKQLEREVHFHQVESSTAVSARWQSHPVLSPPLDRSSSRAVLCIVGPPGGGIGCVGPAVLVGRWRLLR